MTCYLQALLAEGLGATAEFETTFSTVASVSLKSPAELDDGDGSSDEALSLYLYRVCPNPQLNNHRKIKSGPGKMSPPPLSLDLHYLLTPVTSRPKDNLSILGRSAQVLASNPVIRREFLESALGTDPPEARILLEQLDVEELTRLWNAFSRPYRLSASYLVRTVSIDSRAPEIGEGPVLERFLDIRKVGDDEGRR